MNKPTILFFILMMPAFMLAQNIYVATNGNDSNNGSITSPYKTFSKAVSMMSAGKTCIIRGGVYEEELLINKSGTSGNYITFKAADGEKVDIKATKSVSGWQLHSGNIYKATVSTAMESRFLAVYYNTEIMDLARWPNNTDNNRWTLNTIPVTGGNGSSFTVSSIPNIDWTGGLVYYLGAHSGTSWTRTITSSTNTTINHTGVDITKWPFDPHNPTVWRDLPGNNRGQLYLFNKLEALDYAREWYYDNTNNTLYFQTPNGTTPANGTVEITTRKYAAQLTGQYIKVEGIDFFGGSIKISGANNVFLNNKVIHGSEGHDNLSNTGASVGEASIEVLGGNTLIKGCTINHSAVNGIIIQGWSNAHNSIIEGNYISNIDYVGIHATPIRSTANNIKILKNTVWNAGRDGLYVNGLNCETAYNDVSKAELINSDSGVFYTVGNTQLKNSVIHHNWFHDSASPSYSSAKAAGIYLDNDSKGYVVHHNVIWNVSWSGYQVNWANTNLDFFNNTIWNAGGAMDSWVNGRVQQDNRVYNNFASSGDWFRGTGFDVQDNLITSISPFEDANAQNFMPKAGSAVVNKGRVIAGFDNPYKGTAPDLGAYELGGTAWTAGVNAIEDTGEGASWSVLDTKFTISTSTETCPNKNNGTLSINADVEHDYIASFNGTNTNFAKQIKLEKIAPGDYQLCIAVKGKSETQCFNVTIKKAKELTGKSSLSNEKLTVDIKEGTAPFIVFVNNDRAYEITAPSFSISVKTGDEVKIKSSKECEGEIVKTIDFSGIVKAFPNPNKGDFHLLVPINEGQVFIEIYNVYSQLISSELYTVNSGRIDLSLNNQPSGVYFAKIMTENPINVKVIKK